MIEIIIDSIKDTWLTFPLLLITYIILEIFERKPSNNDDKIFFRILKPEIKCIPMKDKKYYWYYNYLWSFLL